jgi:hypothetical protein
MESTAVVLLSAWNPSRSLAAGARRYATLMLLGMICVETNIGGEHSAPPGPRARHRMLKLKVHG